MDVIRFSYYTGIIQLFIMCINHIYLDVTQLCYFGQPQTRNGVDSFGGLGATLVDSLDTLYIMGLHDQFKKARE